MNFSFKDSIRNWMPSRYLYIGITLIGLLALGLFASFVELLWVPFLSSTGFHECCERYFDYNFFSEPAHLSFIAIAIAAVSAMLVVVQLSDAASAQRFSELSNLLTTHYYRTIDTTVGVDERRIRMNTFYKMASGLAESHTEALVSSRVRTISSKNISNIKPEWNSEILTRSLLRLLAGSILLTSVLILAPRAMPSIAVSVAVFSVYCCLFVNVNFLLEFRSYQRKFLEKLTDQAISGAYKDTSFT